MLNRACSLLCLSAFFLTAARPPAAAQSVLVSLIADRDAAAPARHGLGELRLALQVSRVEDVHGRFVVVAGLAAGNGPAAALLHSLAIAPPSVPEALLVRNVRSAASGIICRK